MKNLPRLKFLVLIIGVYAFGALEINANVRPPRVSEIKSCIAQKEKDFGATSIASDDSRAALKESETYVSQLNGLIGCVNAGLEIPNLSWRIRRDWLVKRFEYHRMRQVFTQFSCYYKNLAPTENLLTQVNQKTENRQKRAAQRDLNLLQKAAFRAKRCADRATRFKHMDAEFRQGFREISAQIGELLGKVRELRLTVKKLPE